MITDLIKDGYSMYSPPGYGDSVVFPSTFSFYLAQYGRTKKSVHFNIYKNGEQFIFSLNINGKNVDTMDKKDRDWMLNRLGLSSTVDNYSII